VPITYAAAEGFPYVCAYYRCACGAESVRQGHDLSSAPSDWLVVDDGEQCVCPVCWARSGTAVKDPR